MKALIIKTVCLVVRLLSGNMTAFCMGACQSFVASNICIPLCFAHIFNSYFLSEMQYVKKDRTVQVLIITVLVLILIVYYIFEKRIEALPYKIK